MHFLACYMSVDFIAVVELVPEPEEKPEPESDTEYVKVINSLWHMLGMSSSMHTARSFLVTANSHYSY
jgi:hypothetical protein